MVRRIATGSKWVWVAACVAAMAWMGCAADTELPLESEDVVGAEEGTSADSITATYPAGTRLQTTAGLNLRTGASTSNRIILVMPTGTSVTLAADPGPTGGWYHVIYGGYTGYAYGQYLRLVSTPSPSPSPSPAPSPGGGGSSAGVDGAMARARAGVGFSYWWGHGRWLMSGATSSNAGVCRGSCPSCDHSGSYGADCSGFVGKVWQVPASNGDVSVDGHPYSTASFVGGTGGGQWARVNRGTARRGDAMVYNNGSAGHIFLYDSGDPWGSMWTYEARGCATGIVHNLRTAGSEYVTIRRSGY